MSNATGSRNLRGGWWLGAARLAILGLALGLAVTAANAISLATTTTLTISPASPANAGTVLTLTATVRDANNALVTLGTVNFFDASAIPKLLGTAQLTSSGQATVKLRLGIGSHALTAVFRATQADFGSTSSAQAITVNPSSSYYTKTDLSVSGAPGNYTLDGTLTAFGFLAPVATTLSFEDTSNGNAVLGTGALSAPILGFAPHADYASGNLPVGITSGDFNGDGITDLAATNYGTNQIAVYLGNADGTFQTAVTYAVGTNPYSIAAGDFNGDGKVDLAVTNQGSNTVNVLIGNGDGTFQAASTYAVGTNPVAIAVGDFNKDGKLDLVVSAFNTSNIALFLGNGDGTFQAAVNVAAGTAPHQMAVADFNGDGNLDIAVANSASGTVSVLLGNGNGTFQPRVAYAVQNSPIGVVAGDFRGIGKLDLAVGNSASHSVSVLLGNGDGTFQPQTVYPTGGVASGAVVGDFNGDGKLDLAVSNYAGSALPVFYGNGDGTFQAAVTYATANSDSGYLTTGDFDGSGTVSLAVVAESAAAVSVLRAAQTFAASLTGVAVYGNSSHDTAAVYVPGAADPYAAATSPTMPLAGLYLLFTTPPAASITAGGSPGTVVVSINALGAPVASSTATVQLAVTGPGGYSQTYSVAAVAGVATFSALASPSAAGTYTYTASFPSAGTAGQVAATETVAVGAANKLVITALYPTPVNAGSANMLTVTVEDASGNTVTTFTGTVSLSSATDSLATFNPPSHTFVLADAGVFSFQATFHTGGTQTLTASSTGLASALQAAIIVNDFTLAATPPSHTIAEGQSATYSLSVTSLTSASVTVNLACSGLPTGATCTFTPATVTSSGVAATSTLVISTPPRLARMLPVWPRDPAAPAPWKTLPAQAVALGAKFIFAALLAMLLGMGALLRRPRWRFAAPLALLFLVCAAALGGCSSGFPLGANQSGSYTVTITGTAAAGALQHSTTIVLNVQ